MSSSQLEESIRRNSEEMDALLLKQQRRNASLRIAAATSPEHLQNELRRQYPKDEDSSISDADDEAESLE